MRLPNSAAVLISLSEQLRFCPPKMVPTDNHLERHCGVASSQKPEIAVPEEAAGRGPILTGEFRSPDHRYPSMLVQFEEIHPSTRKARIFLFPTPEQARQLEHDQGPFSFEGSFVTRDSVVDYRRASDIWLKPIVQINHKEATYWAHTSGWIGELEIRERYEGPALQSRTGHPFAWFVADHCFLLQVIANPERQEEEKATEHGFSTTKFVLSLSDGATAEVHRYLRSHRPGILKETKKMGYSIHVKGFKDAAHAKADVDALLLLSSFASRERAVSTYWSADTVKEESVRRWRFNFERFPKRDDHVEPLVLRSRENGQQFIQRAFDVYSRALHKPVFDAAIFALLARSLPLELQIARLFSGIQSALVFALQKPPSKSRPMAKTLFDEFTKQKQYSFHDLWPLFDASTGTPVSEIRNSIVHGEAFSESEFMALSFAAENLQWHLERILLAALGWDIDHSAVSGKALNHYHAYHWQKERKVLDARRSARP